MNFVYIKKKLLQKWPQNKPRGYITEKTTSPAAIFQTMRLQIDLRPEGRYRGEYGPEREGNITGSSSNQSEQEVA